MSELVLSIFGGLGMLSMAFAREGFCVVEGPDLLWGRDVKDWHPPAGRFDGLIAGVPCQRWSPLSHMVRHTHGEDAVAEDMFPEFERVAAEASPDWWLTECSPFAPIPRVDGYVVTDLVLDNRWIGDGIGQVQSRKRRFCFGTRTADILDVSPDVALMENPQHALAVTGDTRAVPVAVGGSGKTKRAHVQDVSPALALMEASTRELAVTTHAEAVVPIALHSTYKPKRRDVLDVAPSLALLEAPERERTVVGSEARGNLYTHAENRIRRNVQDVSADLALLENPERERAVIASGAKEGAIIALGGADHPPKRRAGTLPGQQRRRTVEECCELQGLPPDYLEHAPFTKGAKYRLVGNGVPLPMGRAIAAAVRRARYGDPSA